MEYTQHDRIKDILMYFNDTITLTFVTQLSRTTQSGQRRFYQYEVEKASGIRGEPPTYNITRGMRFFFNIDFKNDFMSNISLMPRDVQMLTDIINSKVLPWFQANSGEYAYQIINDTLVVTEYKPVLYTQSEIKYIGFEPSVMIDRDEKYNFAVTLNFSGKYVVQITLEKFMDFVYLIHSDMYNAACSLCNYVKIQPYGVNIFRPFGLGGGRVDDDFGMYEEEKQATYTNTVVDSTNEPNRQMTNNFLEQSKSKKKGK